MDNNQPQAPQTLNFDGEEYLVEELTPRAATEFNTLFRIQNEINDLAYQLKKCQSAQSVISEGVKTIIKEDKIKPIEKEEIVIEDTIEAKDEASIN
tara:strand:- start:49 stop:336 length:288 start_codon:yes stop_codon:yes gene_type:complete